MGIHPGSWQTILTAHTGLRGNIWTGLSKAHRPEGAVEGWGGAGPVFAVDYSSFGSPLEEVNAIIGAQV